MNNYYLVMDIAIFLIGIYCFYCWYHLSFKKDLSKAQFFLPQSIKPEKCKDTNGFVKRFSPAVFVFSLAFFGVGLVFTINDFLSFFPVSSNLRLYTVPLAVVFIGMVVYTRLVTKKFW